MKIAIVTDQPINTGIGKYAYLLYGALIEANINAVFLYNGYKHSEFPNIKVIIPKTSGYVENQILIPFQRKLNALSLKQYREYFKDYIVHFCGTDYSMVKYFEKSVATVHDLRIDIPINPFENDWARTMVDSLLRDIINIKATGDLFFAKKIVAISNFSAQELKRRSNLHSDVIYHWVDEERFKKRDKEEAKIRLNLSRKERYVLNVSNRAKNKKLNQLKEVADFLPVGYKLLKIGTPIRSKNSINIGNVKDSAYPLYFNASDIYLNISGYEGFGIPQLEALGSHIPVLARDIQINREVLGEAGHYFQQSISSLDIVNKVIEIIENSPRSDFEEKVKERLLIYEKENSIKSYLKLYSEMYD